MQIIQPHYHAIARTAQDYERMAMSGVVAVCEPAFWAGFDRRHPETFIDYFAQISEFEPTRAAEFGIRHYCWVAVNPKEAENKELTNEVLRQMPEFLEKPTCLGVGETGLHKSTPNEIESLQAHVEMAMKHDQLVLIHTPHLSDKAHGTKTVLEVLAGMDVNPDKIWIDHVEEQTIEPVLDAGYWAGMTLYPVTKCSPRRAVDILKNIPGNACWLILPLIGVRVIHSLCRNRSSSFEEEDIVCRRRWKYTTITPVVFSDRTPSGI